MKRASLSFLIQLFILLVLVFGIHVFILHLQEKPLFGNLILLSYVINYILAVVVLLLVERTFKKNTEQAGFVFMAGSGLKFLVFFIVFYPSYREDGEMKIIEFLAFFIPYATCLITEVIYLSKQLNKQTY